MPNQHTTEDAASSEAMLVPLDLDELHIVSQHWLANGTIRVEVMATTTQAACPHCQHICVKIHDMRPRKKRDMALRGHPVELIVLKRRFRCLHCRKSGTRTRYGVWLAQEDDRPLARSDQDARATGSRDRRAPGAPHPRQRRAADRTSRNGSASPWKSGARTARRARR